MRIETLMERKKKRTRFRTKKKTRMGRVSSLRRITAQWMVSEQKMQEKERLTPLILFTPRKDAALVCRRPVCIT